MSCALVWSVTTSGVMPRRTSSGTTSAALPTSPTESARLSRRAALTHASASSSDAVTRSQYAVARRFSMRARSTSTPRNAEPGGEDESPRERAAEVLACQAAKRLIRALHDALRPDVDPRARGHLAEHDEPGALQLAEVLPRGPAADEIRVGDEDAGGVRVRPEHGDGLATLDQQRLVVLEGAERRDNRVEALPVARGLARAAVDDELARPFGHVGIEVVHQHAQGGFLLPALAADGTAARGADDSRFGLGGGGHQSGESKTRKPKRLTTEAVGGQLLTTEARRSTEGHGGMTGGTTAGTRAFVPPGSLRGPP